MISSKIWFCAALQQRGEALRALPKVWHAVPSCVLEGLHISRYTVSDYPLTFGQLPSNHG